MITLTISMTTTKTTATNAQDTEMITTSMRKAANGCALVMSAVSMKVGMRMSDDTISRKATIDAMENVDWYHISKDGRLVHGANSDDHEPLYKAKDVYAVLNTMSSAQPEKRTEERTETHACDLISRRAAIDAEV